MDDESTLSALEGVLKRSKKGASAAASIYDFVGVFSDKETRQVKKAIQETCETISKEDWK